MDDTRDGDMCLLEAHMAYLVAMLTYELLNLRL